MKCIVTMYPSREKIEVEAKNEAMAVEIAEEAHKGIAIKIENENGGYRWI